MKFRSMSEFREYVIKNSQVAIRQAQEEIYGILYRYVQKYYAEYDPEYYERTYQLLRSLVKTEVVPTKNGWKAEVYFDISSLDYSFKLFMKPGYYSKKSGLYRNPFNPRHYSRTGRFEHPTGDPQKVMESAARGEHGGWAMGGTSIWDDPMQNLGSGLAYDILKKWLIKNGVKVK